MGKGKIAAQCAHAAVGTISNISRQGGQRILQYYNMCGQPKIAVRCPDLDTVGVDDADGVILGWTAFGEILFSLVRRIYSCSMPLFSSHWHCYRGD